MSTPMSTRPLLLCSLLAACGRTRAPEIERSHSVEAAEYNCELMDLASEWHCLPEERIVPLSCSWGNTDRNGAVALEGSTGCVTMTCQEVLFWAREDCLEHQDGDLVLRDVNTEECCTDERCGREFGCY